jgi:hypothetical protein
VKSWLARAWRAVVRADERWQKDRRTFPLFRWIIGIILLATTLPGSHAVGTWWHEHAAVLIAAAVIVFGPSLQSLSIGGFKMDLLKETREDLREVRSIVATLQSQSQGQAQQVGFSADDVIRVVKALGGPENLAKLLSTGADQAASEKDKSADVHADDVLSTFLLLPHHGRSEPPPPVDRADGGEVPS